MCVNECNMQRKHLCECMKGDSHVWLKVCECVSISVGRCIHECVPEYVCVCEPVCATGVLLEMNVKGDSSMRMSCVHLSWRESNCVYEFKCVPQ